MLRREETGFKYVESYWNLVTNRRLLTIFFLNVPIQFGIISLFYYTFKNNQENRFWLYSKSTRAINSYYWLADFVNLGTKFGTRQKLADLRTLDEEKED